MELKRTSWMTIPLLLTLAVGIFLWPATQLASGQRQEWRVWMRTAPCSGRTDWVSVAKENPGYPGLGFFDVFPGSHIWPTRAEALAEADVLRLSPLFATYCCREYSVWEN